MHIQGVRLDGTIARQGRTQPQSEPIRVIFGFSPPLIDFPQLDDGKEEIGAKMQPSRLVLRGSNIICWCDEKVRGTRLNGSALHRASVPRVSRSSTACPRVRPLPPALLEDVAARRRSARPSAPGAAAERA